jgi:Arc/MetJ family transcription regulator
METRTNIVINDKLLKAAKEILGTKTKRETVEEALRRIVNLKDQAEIKKLFGKLKWDGNLQESRRAD